MATATVQSCSCVAGCPKCVPGLAPSKAPSTNPRNIALKEQRKAIPRSTITKERVIKTIDTAKVARRAGSKASQAIVGYAEGVTVQAIIEAAPEGLKSYAFDCIVWDVQHGHVVLG